MLDARGPRPAPRRPYTYTCGGTGRRPCSRSAGHRREPRAVDLSSLTNGQSDNLVVTLSLPTGADNTFQGTSSTISFAFTGTQRTATSK